MKEFSTVWGPPHTGGPGQAATVVPPLVGSTEGFNSFVVRVGYSRKPDSFHPTAPIAFSMRHTDVWNAIGHV